MKLWGNLPLNSLSALTLAGVDAMIASAGVRSVVVRMMEEMAVVARGLGIRLATDIEERLVQAGRLGAFRTSMLQDLESGRPLEIDAIVGAVAELGRRLGVPTPTIDAIDSLLRLRAASIPCRPS
jgi:2-dehydropantoate 2-reductase